MNNEVATIPGRHLKAFELPGELLDIEGQLWELHESFGPEAPIPVELQARIDKFCEEGPAAILKVHRAIVAIKGEAAVCKDMAQSLSLRSAAKAATAERFEAMLLQVVDTAFNGKVKLDGLTVWGQDAPSEKVIWEDADPEKQAEALAALPDEYKKVTTELKTAVVKAALKSGNSIAGLLLQKTSKRVIRFKI